MHDESCFLTLTYSDEFLPPYGSLDRRAFPLFMKRLRSKLGCRVRYFHCGEYGERTRRPHYHALLFGVGFDDRYRWATRCGRPAWRSDVLESLWTLGASEIGAVSFESAAYVARYVCKKVTGVGAERHYERVTEDGEVVRLEPEYATMSRRPGIGAGWLARYRGEVYPADEVVARGMKMKPPRYYDKILERESPDVYAELVAERKRSVVLSEVTEERLIARESFAVQKSNLFAGREGV